MSVLFLMTGLERKKKERQLINQGNEGDRERQK
jgi:hypothetical protein